MSDVTLRAEGLSKQYVIGGRGRAQLTFREMLTSIGDKALQRVNRDGERKSDRELFWALKDINFEIERGDVVGVIGRNGAGKSTLLKVLSRITEPTEGRVEIRGRIASLLEVGTGFHPELTGRENIFLNGAILGMTRSEISRKFDEIVDFAGIERFLDTPVKRYSSGMYVRLAFSVAAHLDSEVMVVDEVLAVGDTAFQKRCLGKLRDVTGSGRTVLFVSHNMNAIDSLCKTVIVLREGQVMFHGDVHDGIGEYLNSISAATTAGVGVEQNVVFISNETNDRDECDLQKVSLWNANHEPLARVRTWDDLIVRVEFKVNKPQNVGSVILKISGSAGESILLLSTQPDGTLVLPFEVGRYAVECHIEKLPLAAGEYRLSVGLAIPTVRFLTWEEDAAILRVFPRDIYGSGKPPESPRTMLAVEHEWRRVD